MYNKAQQRHCFDGQLTLTDVEGHQPYLRLLKPKLAICFIMNLWADSYKILIWTNSYHDLLLHLIEVAEDIRHA